MKTEDREPLFVGTLTDHPALAPFTHFQIVDSSGVTGPLIRARTDCHGNPIEWVGGQQVPSTVF